MEMCCTGGLKLLYAVYEYEYVSVFESVFESVSAVVGDRMKCIVCTVPTYPMAGLLHIASAHHA